MHPSETKARKAAYMRGWRKRNPDKIKETNLKSRAKFRDKMIAYFRKYRESHLEEDKARARAWQKRNKDYTRNSSSRYRARRKNGRIENCINKIRMLQLERFCRWCCRRFSDDLKMHIDHIIPLSRGGGHVPDNLCAACPRCNFSKKDKLAEEWLPSQDFSSISVSTMK
jgi:5-methylcytosine-specific restriction endonuclease McrA